MASFYIRLDCIRVSSHDGAAGLGSVQYTLGKKTHIVGTRECASNPILWGGAD